MRLSLIATIIGCLIVGVAGGYGLGRSIYEPKIRTYEMLVSDLTSSVSKLSQDAATQRTQISTLESEKSKLQSDLAGAQKTITSYEGQVSSLKSQVSGYEVQTTNLRAQVSGYEGQVASLKSQESLLQTRLSKILEITVTQHYDWTYGSQTWRWDLPIPMSLYVEYLERSRPALGSSYVDMAKDPKDDLYIDKMIQQINSAAITASFSEIQKVNFVIAFVQNLPYTVDIETTPYNEYPRYPVEMLFNRGGDCEDTSILTAALLDRMGYDVALLLLKNAQHMAVGVSLSGTYGSYYEYMSKKYFYLETTGDGWQIGRIPSSIVDTTAFIYPLRV